MHHRDCDSLSLRLHPREHLEPNDVAPAHHGMGDNRNPVPETLRVTRCHKPRGASRQNGDAVRLDDADHGRVLIKRLAERTAP